MYDSMSAGRIARSQVGYHEGRANGHWNNHQKFSEQLAGFAWSDGQPWCATFVQWCLWSVGVNVPNGARSASCLASVTAYKKAGRFTEYPGLGFQVFFGNAGGTHTGIVVEFDADTITTVEGNTNSSGSPEGDGVYTKTHRRRDAYVYGYGIPYYSEKAVSADPHWNGKNLSASA
jgi:hypothetical protein